MVNLFLAQSGVALAAWAVGALGATRWGAAVALLGVTIAAHSYLSGILLYGILPIVLWLARPAERRSQGVLVGTCVAAAALLSVYFVGYPFGRAGAAVGKSELSPSGVAVYLLAFLGSPLSLGEVGLAVGWGTSFLAFATVVLACAYLRSPAARTALAPWMLLAGYGVAGGIATALGRAASGPGAAVLSRYVVPASYLQLSVPACALVAWTLFRRPRQRRVFRAAVIGAAVLATVSFSVAASAGRARTAMRHRALLAAEACLRDLPRAPPGCLKAVTHNQETLVRRSVQKLRRQRLTFFSGPGSSTQTR